MTRRTRTMKTENIEKVTNIVLIDDHKLFREGVKRILDLETDLKVVAEGGDGTEATKLVKEYNPEVVLMDINMPHMNGIEATANLVKNFPETNVIILSIHDDENYVTHALKTGAQGYLLKEMDSDSLIEAIRVVSEGGSYLHPKVTSNLVQEYRRLAQENRPQASAIGIEYNKPLHLLTKRECQIIQLMAEGNSNRAISEILVISEKTVKNHVSNILQKIKVKDRTHAVVTAIKNGWVEL